MLGSDSSYVLANNGGQRASEELTYSCKPANLLLGLQVSKIDS